LPNCWRVIFLVLPKLDGCQVDLPNCWSCSNPRGNDKNLTRWEPIADRHGSLGKCRSRIVEEVQVPPSPPTGRRPQPTTTGRHRRDRPPRDDLPQRAAVSLAQGEVPVAARGAWHRSGLQQLATVLAEKFAILTQLSSWFRFFDNPNVGFAIIGHQTWVPCYFDTIRTFYTSCTCICTV
jgi:hypothetical protein